jgi:rhamnosyltransferase
VQVSVVIRARDEAGAIGAVLDRLAEQTLLPEVIVVDSGSRDGTLAEVRARPTVRLLELPAAQFTFGRALNLGAAAASGAVVVALSAHALPPDRGWIARVAAWFADERVACVFGETVDPAFVPLDGPFRQDAAHARAHPLWGYGNGSGGFRAAWWRERPFREDLPGAEDREWAMAVLAAHDAVCVLDPALVVAHDHSRDPLRACFARYEREVRGFAMFLDLPPYGLRAAFGEWWGDQGGHRSRARARLDPRRMARLAGKWWGRRAG